MGFWDFFNKKNKGLTSSEPSGSELNISSLRTGIPLKKENNEWNGSEREHNIILLYQFLDVNYELKGYNDSLVNPDTNYLSQNIDAIKNHLFRTIKKVKTYYEDFIIEVDFHIESRSRNGFVEMVEELRMKRKKAEEHLKKINEIEENAHKDSGECQGIFLSYTLGFQNGLAAISQNSILNRKL